MPVGLVEVEGGWSNTHGMVHTHLDDFGCLNGTEIGAEVLKAVLLHEGVKIAKISADIW